MHVHNCLGGRDSIFNCSIAQIVPERAAKLVEMVVYNPSAVQYSWIRSIYSDHMQISCSFGLNLLLAQCAYERRSVAILIVPAFVLFLHLSMNCIHMLAHSEINSTCGKNSRKYGIRYTTVYFNRSSIVNVCWSLPSWKQLVSNTSVLARLQS